MMKNPFLFLLSFCLVYQSIVITVTFKMLHTYALKNIQKVIRNQKATAKCY